MDLGAAWGQVSSSGVTAITYDGGYTTVPLAVWMPEIVCDVADNVRDHVVEDLATVWPLRPTDVGGLDPRVVGDDAVWYCRAGRHVPARIGELAAHR